MLWSRSTHKPRAPEPYRLPRELPPPDPDSIILVMHKGLGPLRIDEMTFAEWERKTGLRRNSNRR